MSETKKRHSKSVKKVDVTASLLSAVSQRNLENVKKLVQAHGLSYFECGSKGYVPLFVAIKLNHIEIAKFLLEQGAEAHSDTDCIDTPLHLASMKGNVELAQLILCKNVPVDARNEKNETPLHVAAKKGYANIVELLLCKNASLTMQTTEGSTPLLLAVEGWHTEVVQMLLKHACTNLKTSVRRRNSTLLNNILLCNPSNGDKINKLVFEIVIQDVDQNKIIDELIDHGFIFSRQYVKASFLVAAVENNYVKLIDSILRNSANRNDAIHNPLLLHTAVKSGRVEIVKLFLNSGFNANAKDEKGKPCLHYSLDCYQDDNCAEIIQLLLTNGADIKEAPKLLHRAVDRELIKVCKVLVENHVDIYALNSWDSTPLDLAVSKSNLGERRKQNEITTKNKILKLLLNSINDVNIDPLIYSAFHHAVSNGKKEAVSIFIEFGVDVDLCNNKGCTPFYLAARVEELEIMEILYKNNVDINQERSLFHAGVLAPSVKVVEMLLKFGSNINFNFYDPVSHSDDSDDDDSNDIYFNQEWNEYNNVVTILKKHMIKMKAAGLDVSKPNTHLNFELFSEFKQDCEEEVIRLKNEKIGPQFTLFDIFLNGKEPSYAKNKLLMQTLKSFSFDAFPIYKNLIAGNLEISQSRLTLLQSGQRNLDVLIKISNKLNGNKYSVLPVELLEEILSYLSYRDLRNLAYCGKVLKRQLNLR